MICDSLTGTDRNIMADSDGWLPISPWIMTPERPTLSQQLQQHSHPILKPFRSFNFHQVTIFPGPPKRLDGWLSLTLRVAATCPKDHCLTPVAGTTALRRAAKRCVRTAEFAVGGLVWTDKVRVGKKVP